MYSQSQPLTVADLGGVQGVQLNPPFLGILQFVPPKKFMFNFEPAYH